MNPGRTRIFSPAPEPVTVSAQGEVETLGKFTFRRPLSRVSRDSSTLSETKGVLRFAVSLEDSMLRTVIVSRVVSFFVAVLVSGEVTAQQAASIAGVVRDTSGGVLPGVT